MRRKQTSWSWLWLFCVMGWAFAIAYIIQDIRGGALDLF